jgi:hypothetical protein
MSEDPTKSRPREVDCDVLVIGSGAEGLSGGINLRPAMAFDFVAARHAAGADVKSALEHKPNGGPSEQEVHLATATR